MKVCSLLTLQVVILTKLLPRRFWILRHWKLRRAKAGERVTILAAVGPRGNADG